jgi:hypothetical protein
VEMVLVVCLSALVVLPSVPCEAALLHRAAKYVITASREEKDTLYI